MRIDRTQLRLTRPHLKRIVARGLATRSLSRREGRLDAPVSQARRGARSGAFVGPPRSRGRTLSAQSSKLGGRAGLGGEPGLPKAQSRKSRRRCAELYVLSLASVSTSIRWMRSRVTPNVWACLLYTS